MSRQMSLRRNKTVGSPASGGGCISNGGRCWAWIVLVLEKERAFEGKG